MTVSDLVRDGIRQAVRNSADMAAIAISDPVEAAAMRENLAKLEEELQQSAAAWFDMMTLEYIAAEGWA